MRSSGSISSHSETATSSVWGALSAAFADYIDPSARISPDGSRRSQSRSSRRLSGGSAASTETAAPSVARLRHAYARAKAAAKDSSRSLAVSKAAALGRLGSQQSHENRSGPRASAIARSRGISISDLGSATGRSTADVAVSGGEDKSLDAALRALESAHKMRTQAESRAKAAEHQVAALQREVAQLRQERDAVMEARDRLETSAASSAAAQHRAARSASAAHEAASSEAASLRAELAAVREELGRAHNAATASELHARSLQEEAGSAADAFEDLAKEAKCAASLRQETAKLRTDITRLVHLLASVPEHREFVLQTFPAEVKAARRAAAAGVDAADFGSVPPARASGSTLVSNVAARLMETTPVASPGDAAHEGAASPSADTAVAAGGHQGAWPSAPVASRGPSPARGRESVQEVRRWVPAAVIPAVTRWWRQQGQDLELPVFLELLEELHAAWHSHQNAAIASMRHEFKSKLSVAKRRKNQAQPYREVLQGAAISRLKTELEHARAAAADSNVGDTISAALRSTSRTRRTLRRPKSAKASEDPLAATDVLVSSVRQLLSIAQRGTHAPHATTRDAWCADLTRAFPAAADGGGGHNLAWTREREASELVAAMLATIDDLTGQVARLTKRLTESDNKAAEKLAKMVPAQAVAAERLSAHTRAITWFGSHLQRVVEVASNRLAECCNDLRERAAMVEPGHHLQKPLHAAADSMESEAAALRRTSRALLESGLRAGQSHAAYADTIPLPEGSVRSAVSGRASQASRRSGAALRAPPAPRRPRPGAR